MTPVFPMHLLDLLLGLGLFGCYSVAVYFTGSKRGARATAREFEWQLAALSQELDAMGSRLEGITAVPPGTSADFLFTDRPEAA